MATLLEPLLPYVAYLALLTRVWVGANFIIHGYPKFGTETRRRNAEWMKSMGIPGTAAHLAALLEFFGGMLLVVGLVVPVVALLFALQMAAISVMKKTKTKAAYIGSGKPSFEIDAVYLLLSIIMIVLGAGALSIDGVLGL